jgi:iron complex outermembrane recepter protein
VPSGATQGFFDAVNIRGFELNNWSGYRRDGLMFANQAQVPLENKERVEVVKGLSALRYGFTNPGGIVNYVPKRPTAQPLARGTLFGNGDGGVGAHVDVGGRSEGDARFGWRVNAVLEREASYVDHVRGPRRMLSGFFDWRLTPSTLVELDLEYQERELVMNTHVGLSSFAAGVSPFVPSAVSPRTLLGQRWGVYPTKTGVYALRLQHAFNDRWLLRTAVQYQDLWRDQRSASIAAGSLQANGDFNVTTFYSLDQTRRPLTTETALEGTVEAGGLKHQLAFGFATMDHKVRFSDSLSPVLGTSNLYTPREVPAPTLGAGLPSTLRNHQKEWAVFVADTVEINAQWQVFAGVRHTRPDYASFDATGALTGPVYDRSATTPSVGVVYKPRPDVSLYASHAQGLEQGGTAPATGVTNPNTVLDPLRSRQLEVGAKAEVGLGATVSGAFFRIDKGLEYVQPGATAGNGTYVQDGRQVHQGVELSVSGSPWRGLRLVGGVLLMDPEVRQTANAALVGKRPVNAVRRQASLFADWDVPGLAGLAVSGGVFHSGDKAVDGLNTLFVPSYTRLDAGLRWQTRVADRPLTLRAYLENLTDRRYFSSVSFGQFQFGAPRTLRVSASLDL